MVSTEQFLQRATLSRVIDRVKPTRTFLTQLLMSDEEVLETEHAELSTYEGDAETAPFVRKNGASIQVSGDQEKFATVETPNIRISRPIEPNRLLTDRRPGDRIHVVSGDTLSSAERYIGRMQRRLRERIDNSIELLVSQLLQGQISYQVNDEANFQITLPRLAAHNISLVGNAAWDSGVAADIFMHEDFDMVKEAISEEEGAPTTHALLGTTAATYFIRNLKGSAELNTDAGVVLGGMDLRRQYEASGAIWLGEYAGVQCWKYPRKLSVNGVSTDLIRPDYVEFVSAGPQMESIMYWGMIPDMDAYEAREFVGRIYSKTWTNPDPSHLMLLAHSRPLPWFARPNATFSLKVTNV